jgi:tripartite-type tricarboxylate transporter receptor subunit TctC
MMQRRLLLSGLAAPFLPRPALAQETWPSRPVRLLVGYVPGGATDLVARVLAQQLQAQVGHPFVVENRAGATGTVAAETVARSQADGYTLLFGHMNSNAVAPVLFPKLGYDQARDFVPIALTASQAHLLLTRKDLQAANVAELVALAKRTPKGLNYASSGVGSAQHLAAEMFRLAAGVPLVHVPYRGSGQAMADLIAGQVDINFDGIGASLPSVREGQIRALAVTTAARISALPALPTLAESGFPGFAISSWFGLFAPTGTPSAVTGRLEQETRKALASPQMTRALADVGAEPGTLFGSEFAQFVAGEMSRFKQLVREADIRIDG